MLNLRCTRGFIIEFQQHLDVRKRPSTDLRDGYRIRILSSLAAALLMMIVLVRSWPSPERSAVEPSLVGRSDESIRIEEIRPTRQSRDLRPPPPAPLPPVVVPDDVILEQPDLDLSELYIPIREPTHAEAAGTAGPEGEVMAEGPKPVRFVEPEYTREAQRRRIRAEVVVSVYVDEHGRVQDVRVLERYLLGRDESPRELVSSIGYGLEEAATSAAERWLFRPAQRNGEPVRGETTITFRFGV